MKATGVCIVNAAEIQKALEENAKLNLPNPMPVPEPQRGEYPLHFDKTRVESFYRNGDSDITVHMYSGRFYVIKYSEEVWNELVKYTQ